MNMFSQKRIMMVLALCVSMNTFAHQTNMKILQDNTEGESRNGSNLVFKYWDIPENQYEKAYLSALLEINNIVNDADIQNAIAEGHKYYVIHKDEILTELFSLRLIERRKFIEAEEKKYKAEYRKMMWEPLLSALPGIISNATMAGLNAGQLQQQQYQQKINRDNEIQAFLASHSSKPSYDKYQQDFGSTQNTNTKSSYRKVTTSNGFEEPLPSASTSNRPDNYSSINAGERVVQGVFVYNSQQAVVRLRYHNGQITAYSTSKDALNREQWISIYPDTPHPTMEIQDGNLARDYKYKVSGGGNVFFFNL